MDRENYLKLGTKLSEIHTLINECMCMAYGDGSKSVAVLIKEVCRKVETAMQQLDEENDPEIKRWCYK